MHGKFDPSMPASGTATLTVCGPLRWAGEAGDLPAEKITIVSVTVTNVPAGGAAVVGHASPMTVYNDPAADEWEAEVTAPHGAWVANMTARGHATVRVVTSQNGGAETVEEWDEPITLT